jgi:hypothetical protein
MATSRANARVRKIRFRPLPASRIPKVIPPRSVVILASVDPQESPDWKIDRGRVFRIGYYNREDGLDCIWLVNESGEYEQTTDRETLLKSFIILKLSNESDLFGTARRPLPALNTSRKPAFRIPSLLAS